MIIGGYRGRDGKILVIGLHVWERGKRETERVAVREEEELREEGYVKQQRGNR